MHFISILLITSATLISGDNYEIIADHKNVANGYFSSNLLNTGLENENDPTANTYSIIGTFDDTKKAEYRGDDGKFGFKLIYKYNDGTTDELIWRQTSFVNDATITGADLSQIPDQSGKSEAARFIGLGLSSLAQTYLDGTADEHSWWFHSVGATEGWRGGIPSDRTDQSAYSMTLYILNPDECYGVTCNDDLVCVEGECVRDCGVLNIDTFLTDCSAEFSSSTDDIDQLQTDLTAAVGRVTANEAAIKALNQTDATESAKIDSIDTRLDDAESDISTIQGEIDEINSILDKFSAQSPGSNFMDGDENFYDGTYTDNKSPLITTETKDLIILFLLALNMVSVCIMCSMWMRSGQKYSKYDKVRGYETEENVQLNH